MQASNRAAPRGGSSPAPTGVPELVARVIAGSEGVTVRCTPHRRTVMARTADGRTLFVKLRDQRHADARAEWHWLHVLPMLGLAVPAPIACENVAGQSALCTLAAPGRPVDALLAEALHQGQRTAILQFCCEAIAPRVRRLHERGLVFRDLYWNHLFATSLAAAAEVVFLDVERVFRPRLWPRRWIVKDLAGLAASFPGIVPARAGLRFLRAYLGDGDGRPVRRTLFTAVQKKQARIRAHAPRYG